ncbi:MAG: PIG-L family deacetylase [Anaerolineaceae bacterium]|nr:PIG-L family deacetylase [Anaerolineaceae bacterium]
MAKTILAIIPHPDDAEFYAGGTLARFIKDGDRVIILTTTDGAKGSFELCADELIRLRKTEAINAAMRLGAEKVLFLGYTDLELDRVPVHELREKYVRSIREYKPDILIAEDYLYAEETHPDHRIVARVASEAVTFANLPLLHPEHIRDGLSPHFTPEKYFYTEDLEAANYFVDISDTFEEKMAALCEHKSQIIFLVEDILHQAKAAGVDLKAATGELLNDPKEAMRLAMQMKAGEVGAKAGYAMGEAFRRARFHPLIEGLIT